MPVLELPQELVEEYALILLVDEIARALGGFDEPTRITAIAEQVRAAGLPVGPGLVKRAIDLRLGPVQDVPAGQVRFVQEGRRYDLQWRAEAGSLDRAMRACLESRGKVVPVDDLVHQTALALQHGPKETRETVLRILETRDAYFVHERRVGLRSWLLDTSGATEEDVVLDNFWEEPADGEDVLASMEDIAGDDIVSVAVRAMEVLGAGITVRMALLAWWRLDPEGFDAVEAFATLHDSDRLWIAPNHALFPAEALEDLRAALGAAATTIADDVGDDGDEPVLREIEIGPEDIAAAVQTVMGSPASLPVEALVERVLELEPDEPGFEQAAKRLDEALREQGEIAMCGRGRWIAPGCRPEGVVETTPESLTTQVVRVFTPQGGLVDAELEDAGLEADLAQRVRDPQREDVSDEDEPILDRRKLMRPDRLVWTLPRHHWLTGTMKIRLIDADFFGASSGISQCIFHYSGGQAYPVWANHGLGLVFGLESFYRQYCPESGAVLRISPARYSGEFRLMFDGESDPDYYLDSQDLARLLALREEAGTKEMSVYDIVCHVLEHDHAGLTFERLQAQVNIVRRTRRRIVASVLSLYHCFHQRGKDVGVWQYDPRKAEQGRRKAKRKFIHEE